jgi:NTE family protein
MNKHLRILSLFFVFNGLTSSAQTNSIHNLVFEGAGIRGIAYSGAIAELENKKVLPGVKRIGGTSAGAITALMLSLGYSANEIAVLVSKTNFSKFNDGKYFFPGGIVRLQKYFGWYRGMRFEKWLGDIILAKTNNRDITFLEMKERGFKDLYITGTSLNQQRLIVFSYESFPHMRIRDAVRISTSIPFYFEAVFIDNEGNRIRRPKNKSGLLLMVDGGFTANFPIRIFDSTKYIKENEPNAFLINKETIGFRIDSDEQIRNDTSGNALATVPIENFKDYVYAFFNIINENLNRQQLIKQDWERTVSISDGNMKPSRIRKLPGSQINTLMGNGRTATAAFLNKR